MAPAPADAVFPPVSLTANGDISYQRFIGLTSDVNIVGMKRYAGAELRLDPEFRVLAGWYGSGATRIAWKLVADDL